MNREIVVIEYALDDFVEILTGDAAGELGVICAVHDGAPMRFSVRNAAGVRGRFMSNELRYVAD